MIVKNLLFFITTMLVLGCKQTHQNDDFNESGILIHHQIIIDNPNNVSGSFFLYSNSGHHYAINEYRAYDRNCSYEPSLQCAKIDSIYASIAFCGCCSSAFLLDQNGMAANSPAINPLR